MIISESDARPELLEFDLAIVAVGYEQRCRWVVDQCEVKAESALALTFGFLEAGSYPENHKFFSSRGYKFLPGLTDDAPQLISNQVILHADLGRPLRVFVDISCMSREMIANVVLALGVAARLRELVVSAAYAPSRFDGEFTPAPIRIARPIRPMLAGWSSQPERPLGAVFGLGCEPGLALGALQVLEPDTAWMFYPEGVDENFDHAVEKANEHLGDIFNVVRIGYDISNPTSARGRYEALLNSIRQDYRVITVPFGPKIFSWCALATIVFNNFREVGLWTFSSREQAALIDRSAEGPIIWSTVALRSSDGSGITSPTRAVAAAD